jgi:hypothetical protein
MGNMINGRHTDYSDEQVAMIRDLWIGGRSASQISRQVNHAFGTRLTRNAIIGKVHRLGLVSPAHRQRASAPRMPSRTPRQVTAPRAISAPVLALVPAPMAVPTKIGSFWPIPSTAKTLTQLAARDCRFPVGEATGEGQMFCAAVAPESAPYCLACATAIRGKTAGPIARDGRALPRFARS